MFRLNEKSNARFNACYSTYRNSASRRKIAWNLTKEEFDGLSQGNCFYCGSPPRKIFAETRTFGGKYVYNGIDRINNNNREYNIDNCISCCKNCNRMKGEGSIDEFLEHIKKVYQYNFG